MMRVVGRSGQVMDLPEMLAKSLLRDGTVTPAKEAPKAEPAKRAKPQAAESKTDEAGPKKESKTEDVEEEPKPKPRRTRKPKTEE